MRPTDPKKASELSKPKVALVPANTEKKKRKKGRRKRIKSQIRKLQNSTDLLASKESFRREVRRAVEKYNPELRITQSAFAALQEAAEQNITRLMTDTNTIAVGAAKRVCIFPRDMQIAVGVGHPIFRPID